MKISTTQNRNIYLLGLMMLLLNTQAQHDAVSNGLGRNALAINNTYSLLHNPAAAEGNVIFCGIEVRHNISKLAHHFLGASVNTGRGTLGMTLSHTGFASFTESQMGMSYRQILGEGIYAAVTLRVFHAGDVDGYGGGVAILPDLSFFYQSNERFSAGLIIRNVSKSPHPFGNEPLDHEMGIGGCWHFSKHINLNADVSHSPIYNISAGVGIEWTVREALYFRTGFRSRPQLNGFGMGYKVKNLQIDIASLYQPLLGYTPSISLSYKW